jgi:hypothetical protein
MIGHTTTLMRIWCEQSIGYDPPAGGAARADGRWADGRWADRRWADRMWVDKTETLVSKYKQPNDNAISYRSYLDDY